MLSLYLSLITSMAFATAIPTFGSMAVHESIEGPPEGFINSGPAPADQMLNLRIGLVQGNMAGLEAALYNVSDPSSPQYGQYLSKEEVEIFVQPSTETTENVVNWLSTNGINATTDSPAGDWLSISVSVTRANELFDTTFSTFTHQQTGNQAVRTLSYSIPVGLKGSLELVHPTVNFPDFDYTAPVPYALGSTNSSVADPNANAAVDPLCNQYIQPSCVLSLYNIPANRSAGSSNIVVTGLLGEYANTADLQSFLRQFRPDIPANTNFILETIDGGQNPQGPSDAGTEANLDVQYTIGIATNIPVTFLSVGPYNTDSLYGFLDESLYLLNQPNVPQVVTTSYNGNELSFTSLLTQRLCTSYMQLGARGSSVIFSSGDGGVSGIRYDPTCEVFIPTFPSGCPFVTVVGSTGNIPETASDFSSGGFSNYFSTPAYQQNDVAQYVSKLPSSYTGRFNASGRAFPDVSAQGERIVIAYRGNFVLVDGTSASAPIVASIISLINDRLITAGKPILGFLNPFLYSAKGRVAFNDITTGTQEGCVTGGFPVTAGWDPVTGLGTPDYNKLLTAVGL